MKPISSLLLLFLTALSVPVFSQNPTAEFDRLMQENFHPDGPGATVLVAKKGQIIYHKAFGMANLELDVPMRTDHVFRIGSVTKQFTAAAILQLAEQGKLSLQDELTKFIPDYPTQGKKITVEQLLNHTSGIKSYTDLKKWDQQEQRRDFTPLALIDYFKNEPMDFDPGTQWKYNNSGYILLGYIIEKVSGQSYGDYISEHFFKPLGMTHSYYGDVVPLIKNRAAGYSRWGADAYANSDYLSMTQPYAAGSLLSTVEDLYIWTTALHAGKVIKPESLKKATTPCILPDGTNTHYGFGLQMSNLLGHTTVEHSGGIHGFLSDLVYVPDADVCVAILTNCDCQPPGDVAAEMAALAMGETLNPPAITVDLKTLEDYVGVYENDKKEQRVITVEDGQLRSMRSGGTKFHLTPFAADQFFFEETSARITFVREKGKGKKVTQALVTDRNSSNNVWVKTDKPLPKGRPEIQLPEAELDKFVGEYELAPGFSIVITREGKQMFGQATGQERFEMFAEAPTHFFLKVVDAQIEFYPEEKGAVNKMTLFQGGQELEGTRVK